MASPPDQREKKAPPNTHTNEMSPSLDRGQRTRNKITTLTQKPKRIANFNAYFIAGLKHKSDLPDTENKEHNGELTATQDSKKDKMEGQMLSGNLWKLICGEHQLLNIRNWKSQKGKGNLKLGQL